MDSKFSILHDDHQQISYESALDRQKELHASVLEGRLDGAIMTLEHPPVLTLGKHASKEFLHLSPEELSRRGVDLVETERGGEVTAHMPGQLVVYPILPIKKLGIGPKKLVDEVLLGSVIKVLKDYGIIGRLDCDNPGVWVEDRKICAVGIRVSQRISTHGIALNVCNDLSLFNLIVPCGIKDRGVTSMAQELDQDVSIDSVKSDILLKIYESLEIANPGT